ncbi:MAG: metal-sensitive transcriptional regulator [Thermomicrobiales bacterium]
MDTNDHHTATIESDPLSPQPPVHNHHHHSSYEADRAKILARLRRIEGQVRGVHKMVEEDKYCVDVLTQISAIVAGLRATGMVILEDHIRGCVLGAEKDEQEAILQELMEAIERFNRSVR